MGEFTGGQLRVSEDQEIREFKVDAKVVQYRIFGVRASMRPLNLSTNIALRYI